MDAASVATRHKRKLRKKRSSGARKVPEWQALPLATWVHAHLRWAEVSRLAPMSLLLRQRGLARFVAWAHERGLRHPQELTRQVLEAYQRHLYLARSQRDGNPLGLRTQQQLIGAVRGWCKWLTREGHIPANPAADLEMPRMPRSLPRTLLRARAGETATCRWAKAPDTGSAAMPPRSGRCSRRRCRTRKAAGRCSSPTTASRMNETA